MKNLILDIETNLAHDTIWLVVTKDTETDEVQCYTAPCSELADAIAGADSVVGHNLIGFDAPVLAKCWDIVIEPQKAVDTLLMSRLLEPSIDGGHSLKKWGERLHNAKTDFDVSDFDAGWSQEMQDYCIQDVQLTHDLHKYLVASFSTWKDNGAQALKLEHDIQHICAEMKVTGFKLDVDKAATFLSTLTSREDEIEQQLQEVFPPIVTRRWSEKTGKELKTDVQVFNPGSRKQIAERLQTLGVEFTKKTEKGNIIIDDAVLNEIDLPEAKLLAEYFLLQKRSGLVKGWIKYLDFADGRVHGSVITNGAVTGRMTHRNPNMAQIPSTNSPYGDICREVWTVEPGRKLVGADLSGIELRCLAHYMKDDDYTKELLDGDIHTRNQEAAGLPTRSNAKTFIYATLYGAGPAKIGSIINGGAKEGKKLLNKFFTNLPKLGILLDKVKRLGASGFITGLDNRKLHIRSEHSALNTLLQSCGAIIAKQWCVEMYNEVQRQGLDAKLVAFVHDELQWDCAAKDAEKVGQIAVASAAKAGKILQFRLEVGADYSVGNTWKDTH